MNIKKHCRNISAYLLLVGIFIPSLSHAELGGSITSITAEQKEFNSSLSTSAQNGVTTYKLTLPSGTILEEYVSDTGIIFAVSWSGPTLPNLQAILGNYFKDYLGALKQSRGAIYSNSENLIIQSSGMMGAFQGFAYLPKVTPVGFSTTNLLQ